MHVRLLNLGLLVLAGVFASSATAGPIGLTFESGTLAGFAFSGQGNATVVSSLGTLNPLFGSFTALLSNGPGDRGGTFDTAILTSNSFTLIASDVLAFNIKLLSGEFTGAAADPSRLDSFLIQLTPTVGPATVLHSSNVSNVAFSAIPGGPVSASAGDTFFDATGWMPISVTGLTGTYTLRFTVADAGDSSFDSAFLIDAAAPATGAPEPASALTFGCGLAALLYARRRWNSDKTVQKRRTCQ